MVNTTKKTVSIYDIAKIVGVSAATVSNVLNNKGKCSEKTRAAVLEVARREGYVANLAAKGLRNARSQSIGIITPDVSNDYFARIVLAVESLMHDRGYTSYICDTGNKNDRTSGYVADMRKRNIDGYVFIGGWGGENAELIGSTPVVCIDHTNDSNPERCFSVENDLAAMTHDQMKLLVERGCKRIAFVLVDAGTKYIERNPQYLAYRSYLEKHGMPLDKNLVLYGPHDKPSLEEAAELIGGLVDQGIEFDGVIAIGDRLALGVTKELEGRGFTVGKDVKVVGLDNSIYSLICSPSISTVDRHYAEAAKIAVKTLDDMINGINPKESNTTIGHHIIERQSTLGH